MCWPIAESAGTFTCTENVTGGPSANEDAPSHSRVTRSLPQANPVPDAVSSVPRCPALLSSVNAGAADAMTVNGALVVAPSQVAETVCGVDATESAGTSKVTVEASDATAEVCSGPPSHCHDIACEALDPAAWHASNP